MHRRDLVLFVALIAIVIALAAVVGTGPRATPETDLRPSTYLVTPEGTQALYWMLEEIGLPVGRSLQPLVEGAARHGSLAFLNPSRELSPAEAHVLMEHVREGGFLLFAAGPRRPSALDDSLGIRLRSARAHPSGGMGIALAARPHPWMAGTDSVAGFRMIFSDTAEIFARPGLDTLLARGGQVGAVTFPLGEGRVLALSDVHPLGNHRLRATGIALPVARAAAEAGEPLWFDEHYHGFREPVGGARILGRLAAGVPTGAWIHLAALGLLALAAAGTRFGAPYPPPPTERRSPLEHVEALAGAYRQAGAKRTTRRLLLAGLARRTGRRAPPGEEAAAGMLARMAGGNPATADAAAELKREWERGDAADLAALSRAVDRFLEESRR